LLLWHVIGWQLGDCVQRNRLKDTNLIAQAKGLALLKAKPWLVCKGFWKACLFVWHDNTLYGVPPTAEFFRLCMKWLTAMGAIVPLSWAVFHKRRADVELFVALAVLGTILSLPLRRRGMEGVAFMQWRFRLSICHPCC
jgi:hypothetical protein